MSKRDTGRLDKLVRKAGSVVGRSLDSLGTVVEKLMRGKLLAIMCNVNHPLHHVLAISSICQHNLHKLLYCLYILSVIIIIIILLYTVNRRAVRDT